MAKYFRVWAQNGLITVTPIDGQPLGDDTEISATKDRYGWRVSSLVQARGKAAAVEAARTRWAEAGIDHLAKETTHDA